MIRICDEWQGFRDIYFFSYLLVAKYTFFFSDLLILIYMEGNSAGIVLFVCFEGA